MPSPAPFGITPLGTFPASVLQALGTQPPAVLADAIDYGQAGNGADGYQPTFEYTSLTKGIHPIDEQVLVAHTRVQNSGAAVQNDGADLSSVTKLTSSAAGLIESIIRAALKRLVTNGDIVILAVTCTVDGDTATCETDYRNLRARDSQKTRTLTLRVPVLIGAAA